MRPDVALEPLLSESDPWWALALKPSEEEKIGRRPATLGIGAAWRNIIDGAVESSVLADVLGSITMYPILSGRPDLYRAFMAQVWTHASHTGISGLIHLETHFTDDKATSIRAAAYRHLRRHWQFINELVLFDIQDQKRYGVNVYGAQKDPQFLHAASLYHPHTVIRSLVHDGTGPEPGIKNDEGQWDQRPHVGRIQRIDTGVLRAWQDALGADHWSTTPMLYTVNAAATRTLQTLASAPRMRDLWLQYSAGWNETTDKQRGRFRQHWGSSSWSDAILQGSHLYVSRPLYKWPNSTMKHHLDWTDVDLESLNPDALPVTSFEPSGDPATYDASYTHWGEARTPARDHYRVAWRAMAANTGSEHSSQP